MTAKYFVDTNVIVYAHDRSEPQKQQRALEILEYLSSNNRGAISTQILSEFFVTATRKITIPLTVRDAYAQIEAFSRSWPILSITSLIVLEAARGVRDYQLNFWDAQLWAAAKLNQLPFIVSEDFNSGATIEGVRFINPFADDFQIAEALV